MATKTQQLRAALEARGFKRVESRSQRPCYTGTDKGGDSVWVWPDEVGGLRYSRTARIGDARPGPTTAMKLLAGQDSNVVPLVPRGPEVKSPVSREEQCGARSELKDAQRKESDVLFEAAWAKLGYQYGADALEQVKLGWRLARGEL